MTAITRANQCKVESVMETNSPKRKLRSSSVQRQQSPVSTPVNWKSPRRCLVGNWFVHP
ncbi:cell division control protein 6-like protein B [Cucumis melo var. makuwa]|uniref:Cell division control protein 6-like protein B n=1 Tax=Cucumis melo var. makuwa TaxID=1194695 RepID=A0A5A7SPM5_CUCMM|nr:cell division control protein 6-like protein B [Cucumis melo var. makuwa]